MKKQWVIALKILLVMTILTGIIYPLLMTGIAQITFPRKANGSLIIKDGKIIGSELIGQKFDSSKYFWPRPSAISYNPIPSGASNWGPTSDTLKKQVADRRFRFEKMNSIPEGSPVPKEMLFASASGLDPHISPGAALMQVDRIAKARNYDTSQKQQLIGLINKKSERPQYGIFGEERLNVLLINIELDQIK